MTRLLLVLGCVGCVASNEPPEIVSFNGLLYDEDLFGFDGEILYAPGDVLELVVEVDDPNGDNVQLWFPSQPLGFDFPPDGTTGVWRVPTDAPSLPPSLMIAEDDHPINPRFTAIPLPFRSELAFEDLDF